MENLQSAIIIEDRGMNILLDTGYSDVYIQNAEALRVDLLQVSVIAFSHGHNDHTRGFQYFRYPNSSTRVRIIAYPDTFKNGISIGSPSSEASLRNKYELVLSKIPVQLSEHLTFQGETFIK